jgi:archaetidylinositol phosphate synthase
MKPLERVNDSLLGPLERPALAWLAARVPRRFAPDHLTAFGVVGTVLTATGFVLSRGSLLWLWLASLGLIMYWAGDSLDGTIARLRRIERPRYGFFIDHTSDLLCQSATFLSLGASPLAHFGVACVGLITFLIAFVYTLINAQTRATMRVTYFYFGPTEIRALLLLGNLLTLAFGIIHLGTWLPGLARWGAVSIHDLVIAILSAAGVTTIAAVAIHDGRVLAAEDPPPA